MKVYLFVESHPSGNGKRKIRPVSWEAPEEGTIPIWLEETPAISEWLNHYGIHEYNPYFKAKGNCLAMRDKVGHWPVPFEADCVPLMRFHFNDPVPF